MVKRKHVMQAKMEKSTVTDTVRVLDGLLPIKFIKNNQGCDITIADKLFVICCVLVNLCESILLVD